MNRADEQRIGWTSAAPALLWTLIFFVVPFIAMGLMSVSQKDGWRHERQFIDEWRAGRPLERYERVNKIARLVAQGLNCRQLPVAMGYSWKTVEASIDDEQDDGSHASYIETLETGFAFWHQAGFAPPEFGKLTASSQLAGFVVDAVASALRITRPSSTGAFFPEFSHARHVVAPCDGTVFRVSANVGQGGQYVKEGDELCTIVPDTSDREVELFLDGIDAPLVLAYADRRGEMPHVRLQFEGWPAIQFSGWPELAIGTFGGKVKVVQQGADKVLQMDSAANLDGKIGRAHV